MIWCHKFGILHDDDSLHVQNSGSQVAYVLGQLQDKSSTDALVKTLMDTSEHPMVRHEAAEALGAIAGNLEDLQIVKCRQYLIFLM